MRKSSLFPRKTQGVDTRYPIGYNVGVAGNDTNAKGTTMRRPTTAQLTAIGKIDAECKRLGAKCCNRPDGISDTTWRSLYKLHLIQTADHNGGTPLVRVGSFGIGWLHAVPKQPQGETTIRVPAKFFDDHEDRDCEPYCTVVKRTSRFVWLRPDDEGLDELLDDAKHYAEPGQFGEWGRENTSLVRSAAATVAAIQESREAMVSK